VDQSGKIEESKDTGLAFSQEGEKAESFSEAILIRKEHKERLKPLARSSLGSTEKYRMKLFACGLFMLTQEHIDTLDEIVIEKEWEGKRGLIKSYLYNFYSNNISVSSEEYPELSVGIIHSIIEGTPKAHELAYDVREGNIEPYLVSDFKFLKGMILSSPGKGRNT